MMNGFEQDLQQSDSLIQIPINKVGIKGLKKRVDVFQDGKKISMYPKISAVISLPAKQRGIHMSRTPETIDKTINETVFRNYTNIGIIAEVIAKKLFKVHDYSDNIEIILKGEIAFEERDASERQTQKIHEVLFRIKGKRNKDGVPSFRYFLGVSAVSATVCPCGKSMSREYSESIIRNRKDISISDKDLEKLLNLLPIASHNQRAVGKIYLEIGPPSENFPNLRDLVDIIENSMSGRVKNVLKREEEAEFIRSSHLNPVFSEDVIRRMAQNFIRKYYSSLEDNYFIKFSLRSFESIHPYDVFSELSMTIGELKNFLSRSNKC